MSRQRAEKGGLCAGSWSITRRFYEQDPRPLGQSGTPSRLHPDRRRGVGLHCRRTADANPCCDAQGLLADKGYDGDRFRESLLIRGILPIIPPRSNRKVPEHPDYRRYKDRNRIERMFGSSSNSAASPRAMTRPSCPSTASSTSPPHAYG